RRMTLSATAVTVEISASMSVTPGGDKPASTGQSMGAISTRSFTVASKRAMPSSSLLRSGCCYLCCTTIMARGVKLSNLDCGRGLGMGTLLAGALDWYCQRADVAGPGDDCGVKVSSPSL